MAKEMKMIPLECAKKRLEAFIHQIGELKQSEFPYKHSEDALLQVESDAGRFLSHLMRLPEDGKRSLLLNACRQSLDLLYFQLPVLGFILRSTNVRNAFEAYSPLLRLARCLLGPDIRLIISSEWEYAPLLHPSPGMIPDFVLIGLPAHESGNPLLIPLSGHELGHSLWRKAKLKARLRETMERHISDGIRGRWAEYKTFFPDIMVDPENIEKVVRARDTLEQAVSWCQEQAEEVFCDLVGLLLFGSSYAHAFAYLLSPCFSAPRPPDYPARRQRVAVIERAAGKLGIFVQSDYSGMFQDLLDPPLTKREMFMLSMADRASDTLVAELMEIAEGILKERQAPRPDPAEIAEIRKRFDLVVPAQCGHNLASILCAGWEAFNDKNLWINVPQIKDKDGMLRELILKSMEEYDLELLAGPSHDAQGK